MRSSLKKLVSVLLVVVCIFTANSEVFAGSERILEINKAGTNYVTIKGDNSSDWIGDKYEVWIYGSVNSVSVSKSKNCTSVKVDALSSGAYRITFKVKRLSFGKILVKIQSSSADTDVRTSDNEVSLYKGNCY